MANDISELKYPVSTIIKADTILKSLAEYEDEIGVTDLSKRVGMSPSTTHRFLDTLVAIHYVEHNPQTRRYRLGHGLLQMGLRALSQRNIVFESRPILEELAQATGETAKLGMLINGRMVYINVVESSNYLRFSSKLGTSAPCNCTAMGKLLIAFLDDRKLERIFETPLQACTPQSVIQKEALLAELEKIKRNDYAEDNEELVIGSRGLAVPVRDAANNVRASVSISAPTVRLSEQALLKHLPALREAAQELAEKVKFR